MDDKARDNAYMGLFLFCVIGIVSLMGLVVREGMLIIEATEAYKEVKAHCPCWVSNSSGFNPNDVSKNYDVNGTSIWDFINKTRD